MVDITKESNHNKSFPQKRISVDLLKHPLFLLIAGTLLSGYLIPLYYKTRADITERTKAQYELLKEISDLSGKALASCENIISLHQQAITKQEQIDKIYSGYNDALTEFTANYLRIIYRTKIIFKESVINIKMEEIKKDFSNLTEVIGLLLECRTNEHTIRHAERIDRSKKEFEKVKSRIDLLADNIIKVLR
ncbi:MAG: hypothetical protein WCB96_05850 [Candidatus Aminicenantales bacterium]